MNARTVERHYATNARRYDLLMRPFAHVRLRAIALLNLTPGACVLELGCGTGTSFGALVAAIAPHGRVVGVDQNGAMLQVAQQKIVTAGWINIHLVQATAEQLAIGTATVDAVLVFYSNDILTNPAALDQSLTALRPSGRFVIAGAKLASGARRTLLNPLTRSYAERSVTTSLTTQPWEWLEQRLGPLELEEYLGGSAFVAGGTKA